MRKAPQKHLFYVSKFIPPQVPSLSVEIPFLVYLLNQEDRLVFTDVDGTITEEDVTGRVFPAFGIKVRRSRSFKKQIGCTSPFHQANHDGVVKLYDEIVRNGYVMIYLTGRSMGEDSGLREYLFEVGEKLLMTSLSLSLSISTQQTERFIAVSTFSRGLYARLICTSSCLTFVIFLEQTRLAQLSRPR